MTIARSEGELADFVGVWTLNPALTSITFRTHILGLVPVNGTLKAIDGDVQVDHDGSVAGTLVIDPASINTKIAKRDNHLRAPDFFEVERFPTITFTATEATPVSPGSFAVAGTLSVRDRVSAHALVAEVSRDGDSATLSTEYVLGKQTLGMKKATPSKSLVCVSAHFERVQG